MAKFRKVQTELGEFLHRCMEVNDKRCFVEESAERADLAENQLGKLRAKNRSTVSASRTTPPVISLTSTDRLFRLSFSVICEIPRVIPEVDH